MNESVNKTIESEKVVENKTVENKEVIDLETKIKDLESKLMYKDAELINYRKRKDEETRAMLKYSNADLILEIIAVVDDFERAINSCSESSNELMNFLSGIKMVYTKLVNILNTYEVKEIDSLNKPFDPMLHQAVLTTKEEGVEQGIVLEVLQKGYIYKDKVIRHSMVRVSE